MAFDATGIKISGEGEWKVRAHGDDKRHGWTKLHIAINSDSQEILAAIVTGSEVHDGEVLEDFLEQIPEGIKDGFGDLCPFEGTVHMILNRVLNCYRNTVRWRPFPLVKIPS